MIPEYEDRGRLQAGTREQMQAAAMRGYLADTLDGKDVAADRRQQRRGRPAVPRDPGAS